VTEPLIDCQRKPPARRIQSIDYLPALFLAVALLFLPKVSEPGSGNSLAIIFVSIVLEAIPFMLLGSLVGGVIEAFVSRERLVTLLPKKGWLTVLVAAGAGTFFPVCECAVVPVVRRLVGKGLPTSAAIAYLLGGPIVNPIVAASTALAYAFDWRIVILRLALGYGIAVVIGLIMGRAFSGTSAIREDFAVVGGNEPASSCCDRPPSSERIDGGIAEAGGFLSSREPSVSSACGCGHTHSSRLDSWVDKMGSAFNHAMEDFLAVGHYLVIGAFVAAVAQTYIDRSSFLDLSAIPILSVVLMMALAILLNLCSEADAFIAASFQGLVSVPAQLAFLLTGPMFDLKLLLMYQSLFRRRTIVVLTTLILVAVLITTAGLEFLNGMVP
jgi:uncharacterized membrane protein YraQ (UPF0718 family)